MQGLQSKSVFEDSEGQWAKKVIAIAALIY